LGPPGTERDKLVLATESNWAGPPRTLEYLAKFLLNDKDGCPLYAPEWPEGVPFPTEPEDEGLLIGETVWPFEPDDEVSSEDDEKVPALVRRESMDSSDEDSDEEPPPQLTRDLLVESSSESESENKVIVGQPGLPTRPVLARVDARLPRMDQISWCRNESDGESTTPGAKWTGEPEFTETMWDEMLPEVSFGEANCRRLFRDSDEESIPISVRSR
jgi:hypothetical protein